MITTDRSLHSMKAQLEDHLLRLQVAEAQKLLGGLIKSGRVDDAKQLLLMITHPDAVPHAKEMLNAVRARYPDPHDQPLVPAAPAISSTSAPPKPQRDPLAVQKQRVEALLMADNRAEVREMLTTMVKSGQSEQAKEVLRSIKHPDARPYAEKLLENILRNYPDGAHLGDTQDMPGIAPVKKDNAIQLPPAVPIDTHGGQKPRNPAAGDLALPRADGLENGDVRITNADYSEVILTEQEFRLMFEIPAPTKGNSLSLAKVKTGAGTANLRYEEIHEEDTRYARQSSLLEAAQYYWPAVAWFAVGVFGIFTLVPIFGFLSGIGFMLITLPAAIYRNITMGGFFRFHFLFTKYEYSHTRVGLFRNTDVYQERSALLTNFMLNYLVAGTIAILIYPFREAYAQGSFLLVVFREWKNGYYLAFRQEMWGRKGYRLAKAYEGKEDEVVKER